MRRAIFGRGRWPRSMTKVMRDQLKEAEVQRVLERNARLIERGLGPRSGINAKGTGESRRARRAIARNSSLPDPRVCPVCDEPKPNSRQWVVIEMPDGSRAMCRSCFARTVDGGKREINDGVE